MKINSNSLYSRMGKELRDEFFGWYLAENPGYEEMLAWFDARGVAASNGSLWTLTTKHISTWKIDQAIAAGDEEADALPSDIDVKTKERVRGLKFDLVMSDLTAQQKLAYLAYDQRERELSEKQRTAREIAVDALLKEADGDPAATALLQQFLQAIDARRAKEPAHA